MPKAKSRNRQQKKSPQLSSAQKSTLRKLQQRGLIKTTGNEATTTLKRKIGIAKTKYATELDDTKTFFIKTPRNKTGAAIKARAEKMGLITTDKGIFYERGFRRGSSAELKTTKTGKATLIIKEPKTEKSRARTIAIPIEGVDELERKKDRLRKEAEALGPLKKGEHLTFRVTEKNREGISKHHFRTADQIFHWISQYERAPSRRLNTPGKRQGWRNYFYRHIDIVKMTTSEQHAAIKKIRDKREQRHQQYLKAKKAKRQRDFERGYRAGVKAAKKRR